MTDYFAPGDWNIHCADCGRKAKASELVKNWKGFYVHPFHTGIQRHPQDFVRGVPDAQPPAWTQPPPEDSYQLQTYNYEEDQGVITVAAPGIITIHEGVTIDSLTLTGAGVVIINNLGIVVLFDPGAATVTVHNFGGIFP